MATKIELVNASLAEIRKATWTPEKWVYAIGHGFQGKPYNFAATHNFKAQQLMWDAAKAPGDSPPPSAFASPALMEAFIRMEAAYWPPQQWCEAVRDGHKGLPYQYANTRNWQAQQFLWEARAGGPPPPPPPPPGPTVTPNPRLQSVAVGAFSPWDALAWPGCRIWLSADPNPVIAQHVSRAKADAARHDGHDIGVWYVPDQVSLARAQEVANTLATDLIVADCETLYRWKIAYHSGVRNGIYNLSAFLDGNGVFDPEAEHAISSGEFHGINEFYWNQDKTRQPDNHNVPVDALCIAVYDGHSDSTAQGAWEPHVPDYASAGYLWPTVCIYQQNVKPADWAALPVPAPL